MGCDIHMYIEYKEKDREVSRYGWKSFGGRINPGRNYNMFARLASIRGEFEGISLQPKGIPKDMGYQARGDNQLYITPDEGDEHVTPERAERYVKEYGCEYINNQEGKPTWVTNPDWHSHSWLTAKEYAKVVEQYHEQVKDADKHNREPEYRAMVAAMQSLENDGYDTRIVFWFDN